MSDEIRALLKQGDNYRSALMWAFDRLSIDGGMTALEQRYTMKQIGHVLLGEPSPAATYEPNDWDQSAKIYRKLTP